MNFGDLGVLIPILALSIPVLAIFFNGLQKTIRLRIEETQARAAAASPRDLQTLMDEVDRLREELAEVHERLDFTERMLARGQPDDRPPHA
jgi:hypothetical protein